MTTNMKDYIASTEKLDWQPLTEDGIDTNGIFVKPLRYDEITKRAPSFMLKFEAGAKYPYHNHPAGEEVFVLQGSAFFNDTELNHGDYLYTPPGFKHAVYSKKGCILLLIVPREVEIIAEIK